ncbi:phospholipase D-like domain-containing protein [Serratia fonticola]|uniref:phospholipase D-like domain-containing protein n=1 Tax=Serratia fonticola TaxID=47917 RepID=UPI00301E1859
MNTGGYLSAAQYLCCSAQIAQTGVGTGDDESRINGDGAHRRAGLQPHVFQSLSGNVRRRRTRGVAVRVVADEKANNDRYTAVTFLANQDVPVRLDSRYAIMHNKFMVIDGSTVETGSFNFTASAVKRNAENALLIENAPELAAAYQGEFNRLWNESTAVQHHY